MARSLALEAFDVVPKPVEPPPGPSEDWKSGHAAGVADGLAKAGSHQAVLTDAVVQAISDMTFTYAEARAQVLSSLQPLFAAMMSRLLPDIARAVLLPHVVELLGEAARADSRMPIAIAVHPSLRGGIDHALGRMAGPGPLLLSDPYITPGQVILRHGVTETALDLDGLVAELTEVLAAILDPSATEARHG